MVHEDRGDNPYPYIVIGTTAENPDKGIRDDIISFRNMADGLADLVLIGVTSDLLHDRVRPFMPGTCPEVCDKLSVNWNGDVTACCGDWDDMMIVGNINEEPIDKIWRGERITQIREMLAANRYKDLLLCRRCSR